jgi:hypothetical protein
VGELKEEGCIKGIIAMALHVLFEPRLKKRNFKTESINSF